MPQNDYITDDEMKVYKANRPDLIPEQISETIARFGKVDYNIAGQKADLGVTQATIIQLDDRINGLYGDVRNLRCRLEPVLATLEYTDEAEAAPEQFVPEGLTPLARELTRLLRRLEHLHTEIDDLTSKVDC